MIFFTVKVKILEFFDHSDDLQSCLISGSGELEFEEFCILAAQFLIEEDEEQMRKDLKEAFRFYDREGLTLF